MGSIPRMKMKTKKTIFDGGSGHGVRDEDDEEAAAYKAALGRASPTGEYGELGRDGGRVYVLMYARSKDDKNEDTS